MANPISIAASVITLAATAAQISKALSKLRAFGELPQQVYVPKNEVTDLEVVLRQIGHRLQQQSWTPDIGQESLKQTLARAKVQLAGLANGLERIANACAGGKVKTISRCAVWFKEKVSFQYFQSELHPIKTTLNLMLSASNSHDLQHIVLELRQVTVLTLDAETVSHGKANSHGLDEINARVDAQYQSLQGRIDGLGRLILEAGSQDEKQAGPSRHRAMDDSGTPTSNESLRVLISHRVPCRNWCPCACHAKRKVKVKVPGILESFLGKMFVGYTGLPVLNKSCDFRGYRERQVPSASFEYWFPWWFASMNLKMCFKYLSTSGPQLQLSTTRRVPDTVQSISFAMQGNVEGLKYLFSQGLASPRDVSDSRGYSLMRYPTVKFLIDSGAPVDDISYENVWDFLFRGKCNEREQFGLRCITERVEGDWVEEQNFPLVHGIVFGLSSKLLAVELDENPAAIYLTDIQGRTALDWATARAQLEDIATLLSCGADPNTMDITGRTTILHAVDSHNTECLRLVLAAGGHPDPAMPKGVFRSSPLTAAGFGGLQDMLRLLLEYGADPNACNPEGFTALHSVARIQNVQCARTMLEYGADPNAISSNCRTPLLIAVTNNNHPVLELFLNHYRGYKNMTQGQVTDLLPIVAGHADYGTLAMLSSSYLFRRSLDLSLQSIATSHDILRNRRDFDEKLFAAFEELLALAQTGEAETTSLDSPVDSNIFLSTKSSFHSDLAEARAELESEECSSEEGSMEEDEDRFTRSAETLLSPV